MKRCVRCILPETFPGIRFNEEGLCHYCLKAPDTEHQATQKANLRARFEELIQHVRPRQGYHCLMAWSGGKDSTYTLWLLKKRYNLCVQAFTFNNGFVSPTALKNTRAVAENLEIDHLIVKPRFDILRQIFLASMQPGMYPPRALERASAICNSCMALAKGIGLRMALEHNIPLLVYGWSPGQIPLASALFHTNHRILQVMIKAALMPLEEAAGEQVDAYFPEKHHLEKAKEFPYVVAPLAFLDYDEENSLSKIRTLGWERPQDTDPNSTNCLLNSLGTMIHLEQMGYHPYAMELAGLVRGGYLDRQEALDRLEAKSAPEVIAAVEAKLGISPSHLRDGEG